jgi:hypothetical protein
MRGVQTIAGQVMRFEKGHTGRPRGTRNRLANRFLEDSMLTGRQNGAAALDICFKEDPVTYCKIVAGTVPRDYRIETAKITELAEDELDRMIEQLREHALAERQERAFELNPAPLVLLNGR